MNKAILIGNLTRDPEMRTTGSGVVVTTFTLAVNRRYRDEHGERLADFIPIVVWRQLAERCAQYLQRGRKCAVTGTIQTRTYDAPDGTKRYVTEVIAEDVEFLGGGQGQKERPSPPPSLPRTTQERMNMYPDDEAMDDLPF